MSPPKGDRDKAELFKAFCASTFNAEHGPRGSQRPELDEQGCNNDQLPELVWNLLLQLDPSKPPWDLVGFIRELSKGC